MNGPSKRALAILTLTGFAFGMATAVRAGTAAADYRAVNGAICQPDEPSFPHSYIVDDGETGAQNYSTTTTASFTCPIVDNSDLRFVDLTSIQALVYDHNNTNSASGQVQVKVCAWNTMATTTQIAYCGFHSSSGGSFTGATTVTVGDLGALDGYGNTGYVQVSLPRHISSYPSRIMQLYFSN